ncbi:hypothetical protein C060_00884 [Brucella melitensis UK22/04]|nr:hypothetical protein C060_00884 [Brucella melitensis UK22/04]
MLKSSSRISRFFASVAFGTAVLCASGAMASTSWVVFDADSGRMLGQDDASAQHAPASLAKMMTLYLTFEALKTGRLHWDDALPISKNAASKVRMKLWLKAGDTISTRDAVNGMIIVSANDAATVMGEYLAGSEAAFARLMTQRAPDRHEKHHFRQSFGADRECQPVDDCTRHGGAGHGSSARFPGRICVVFVALLHFSRARL